MVLALNTGHDGSLTTCHGNGPAEVLERIEAMVLMGAPSWPPATAEEHVRRSIDVVVHLARATRATGRRQRDGGGRARSGDDRLLASGERVVGRLGAGGRSRDGLHPRVERRRGSGRGCRHRHRSDRADRASAGTAAEPHPAPRRSSFGLLPRAAARPGGTRRRWRPAWWSPWDERRATCGSPSGLAVRRRRIGSALRSRIARQALATVATHGGAAATRLADLLQPLSRGDDLAEQHGAGPTARTTVTSGSWRGRSSSQRALHAEPVLFDTVSRTLRERSAIAGELRAQTAQARASAAALARCRSCSPGCARWPIRACSPSSRAHRPARPAWRLASRSRRWACGGCTGRSRRCRDDVGRRGVGVSVGGVWSSPLVERRPVRASPCSGGRPRRRGGRAMRRHRVEARWRSRAGRGVGTGPCSPRPSPSSPCWRPARWTRPWPRCAPPPGSGEGSAGVALASPSCGLGCPTRWTFWSWPVQPAWPHARRWGSSRSEGLRVAPSLRRGGGRAGTGEPWARAVPHLVTSVGEPARAIVHAIVAAEQDGASMGTVLSRLAEDARRQRRHDLEAAVRRLPVRLSFPLVCCSLPAFVLLTVVPLVAAGLRRLGPVAL